MNSEEKEHFKEEKEEKSAEAEEKVDSVGNGISSVESIKLAALIRGLDDLLGIKLLETNCRRTRRREY